MLFISITLELWQDAKRQRQDQAENQMKAQLLNQDEHAFETVPWSELKVGQIVRVEQNQRFPADLILLKSSNPNGAAYVETIGLDGEPNLKYKEAIRDMQDAILSPADAGTINGHIKADLPNDSLYNFDGLMTIRVKNLEENYKYALNYQQLLLRGTSLRTTHWIYGIVVYTGHETKMHQHYRQLKPRSQKISRMTRHLNFFVKCLIALQITLALYATYAEVEFEQG